MLGLARVGAPSPASAASVFHSDVAPADVTPCQVFVIVCLIVASWRNGLLLPSFVIRIAGSRVSGIIAAPIPVEAMPMFARPSISACTAITLR